MNIFNTNKVKNFKQLDSALKNSFEALKEDLQGLKDSSQKHIYDINMIRREVDIVREDTVTKDKFNILKLKIAEMEDSLKRLKNFQSDIKNIDMKTVSKSSFYEHLEELNKRYDSLKDEIVKFKDTCFSKNQAKDLSNDINKEFANVVRMVNEFKNIKHLITYEEAKKRADEHKRDLDSLRQDFARMKKDSEKFANLSELKNLVSDVNAEFDYVKSKIESAKKENYNEINSKFNNFSAKIENYVKDSKNTIEKFDKEMKLKATAEQFKGLSKDMDKNINELNSKISKNKEELRFVQENYVTSKNFKMAVKDLERKYDDMNNRLYDIKSVKNKGFKVEFRKVNEEPFRKTKILANILITVSFLLLGASIVSFFMDQPALMDYSLFSAIGLFVLGLATRMFVTWKRK